MKRDEGSFIQYIFCVIIILVCALLIAYSVSVKKVHAQKSEVEDSITSAALAAAVIDINEYGTYKYIRSNNGRGQGSIADSRNEWGSAEDNLLKIFRESLATNLNAEIEAGSNKIIARDSSIIDGEIKITKFWVYNKELIDIINCPDCDAENLKTNTACTNCHYNFNGIDKEDYNVMIKDYKGRWIKKHAETNNVYIYKYDSPGAGFTKSVERVNTNNGSIGVYTPYDNNIINNDGTDGAGGGHILVKNMTIYATVEFYITPFGANISEWGIYGGSEDDDVVSPERMKITKSVVVDVQPKT